jgi:hypothetical protein
MNLTMSYLGRSGLRETGGGERILQMAPNLQRDAVAFDAPLTEPLRFREAISALHDIVINDLTFQPRDKTAYQQWRKDQANHELAIAAEARDRTRKQLQAKAGEKPSGDLKRNYNTALNRYWKSRRQLNDYLRKENEQLWRKLMPFDPVITVADDVVFFECFSTDESSYGCLTVERHACFGATYQAKLGTTNVDYSWDLYNNFQSLRTYRQTRFNIDPEGFRVQTSQREDYHEEKIELPDGWLRGFMQLQSAMGLPMRRVTLSVAAVYSLLAFLKRNKARTSPRAIRFELVEGRAPRMVLEPWEKEIVSHGTKYTGPTDEPLRIWGRRRLLTLARLLPLAESVDVYLLGTGLPSFWVVRLGNMRLTLGLSGWTANDWTRGSAVQMLLPPNSPTESLVAKTAERLSNDRSASLQELSQKMNSPLSETASALNQLALRGQVIHDLHQGVFRWRQVLPMALSDREMGPPHPEVVGAGQLLAAGKVQIGTQEPGPRGGLIVAGKVENQNCEALINGDGIVRKGKCKCSWHFKFGIRNGPCRHIQAMRDLVWLRERNSEGDWYAERLRWAGK